MIAKRVKMGWAPAAINPLASPSKASLGQTQSVLATKEVAIATDLAVLTGSAFMLWGTIDQHNKWSTFWWIASGVTAFKLLHDLSRPS